MQEFGILCIKYNERGGGLLVADEIIGYRCPGCKTVNQKDVTYCTYCGAWLLDTVHEAIPVTRKDYANPNPSRSTSSFKNRVNTPHKSNSKMSVWIFISIVAVIAYFGWPKTQVMQAINYSDIPTVSENYSWTYNNAKYSWQVEIPSDLVGWDREINSTVAAFYDGNSNGYTQRTMEMVMSENEKELVLDCSANGDIGLWVTEKQNYDYIKNIAIYLNMQAEKNNFNLVQKIEFIQSFVGGAIPYVVNGDYQLPGQTLVDGGNCETKSILLCSILKYLNYKVALLTFDAQNHVAVGINIDSSAAPSDAQYFNLKNTKYYYLETTEPGWKFGEIPTNQNYSNPSIDPIN
jgi:hypothetical protein